MILPSVELFCLSGNLVGVMMRNGREYPETGTGAEGCFDLERLFGNDRRLEVDLGCGKGLFLVNQALARPQLVKDLKSAETRSQAMKKLGIDEGMAREILNILLDLERSQLGAAPEPDESP